MSVIQDNSITTNSVEPASGQSLVLKKAGGTASITVATNGEATFAENIKITANKGINFSAYGSEDSSSATTVSNNLLDDYEEGTWTPVIDNVSGFSGSITDHDATYTKVGRQVTLIFKVILSSSTGNTTAGDDIVLTSGSLPFTPLDNGNAVGTAGMQVNMGSGEDIAMGYLGVSGSNGLGIIFHTVDGTVSRNTNVTGVATYFTS